MKERKIVDTCCMAFNNDEESLLTICSYFNWSWTDDATLNVAVVKGA